MSCLPINCFPSIQCVDYRESKIRADAAAEFSRLVRDSGLPFEIEMANARQFNIAMNAEIDKVTKDPKYKVSAEMFLQSIVWTDRDPSNDSNIPDNCKIYPRLIGPIPCAVRIDESIYYKIKNLKLTDSSCLLNSDISTSEEEDSISSEEEYRAHPHSIQDWKERDQYIQHHFPDASRDYKKQGMSQPRPPGFYILNSEEEDSSSEEEYRAHPQSIQDWKELEQYFDCHFPGVSKPQDKKNEKQPNPSRFQPSNRDQKEIITPEQNKRRIAAVAAFNAMVPFDLQLGNAQKFAVAMTEEVNKAMKDSSYKVSAKAFFESIQPEIKSKDKKSGA